MDTVTMNQISAFLREFGLPTLFVLILLYGLFLLLKRDQKRADAVAKREQDRNDKLLVMFMSMKGGLPDPEKESVEILVSYNAKIHDRLEDMLHELFADYGQLWQFHNGTYGIGSSRTPFMMMTPTHLVWGPGLTPEKMPTMQLPMSLYIKFSSDLTRQEMLTFQAVEGVQPSAFEEIMLTFGAKSSLVRAIHDTTGKVIAFMVIGWQSSLIISDDIRNKFVNDVQTLAAIMASVSVEERKT